MDDESGSPKTDNPPSTIDNEKLTKTAGIETASNKRMRSANLNTWSLRFNEKSLETKVRKQKTKLNQQLFI